MLARRQMLLVSMILIASLFSQHACTLEALPPEPPVAQERKEEARLSHVLAWTRYFAASSVALLAANRAVDEEQTLPLILGTVGGILVVLGTTTTPDEPVWLDRLRRSGFATGWILLTVGLWMCSASVHEEEPLWRQALKGAAGVKALLATGFFLVLCAEADSLTAHSHQVNVVAVFCDSSPMHEAAVQRPPASQEWNGVLGH